MKNIIIHKSDFTEHTYLPGKTVKFMGILYTYKEGYYYKGRYGSIFSDFIKINDVYSGEDLFGFTIKEGRLYTKLLMHVYVDGFITQSYSFDRLTQLLIFANRNFPKFKIEIR